MNYKSSDKRGLKPFELLLDQDQIGRRIAEMGRQITGDYAQETPVVVGVLKGCIIFMADLMRHIKLSLEVEFVSAASYRQGEKRESQIVFASAAPISMEGRHVLVVEGVVDTGRTAVAILKLFNKMKPASIQLVTLIDKPTCHRSRLDIKYKGFSLGNDFVIGYGLDNTQKYRNLPFIGRLIEPK